MAVRQELEEKIQLAGQKEPLDLLPPNPSFFQRELAELVIWRLGEDLDSSQIGFSTVCKETFDRLCPVVDFLTQPRSIAEFQDLKKGLLEIVWQYDPHLRLERGERFKNGEEKQIGKVVEWLSYLLFDLKIFPHMELESLSCGQRPQDIWEAYEERGSRRFRQAEEKIKTFEEAVVLAKQVHEGREARVGYTIGKWRLGPHSEHVRLFEEAKLALGMDGLLFVGVESQRSIRQRRGEEHFCLSDEERLGRIASLEAVDYVVLFDPTEEELGDLNGFYYRADQRLYRDVWFVGSQDYHWLPRFEERAQELGIILLWRSPTSRLSSTELIDRIQKAGQE